MAYLFNNPTHFADEFTEGFAAAYRDRVRQVPGGVVRASRPVPGHVAVVIGGGSGHYPAFAGLVGEGLAHGAAMGNLFASPSAQQVYSVAKAAHSGGGVLLCYGNYAGDVLNFTQAQERLRSEGIDVTTVVVTDDVSSASVDETAKRRGIAGDLVVFKAAGALADAGASLAEVAEVAARANDRTRSFGVAFTGCTLPGASAPLFTVPAGRMAVGMGIHGEPGVGETDVPTADELAELLVSRLLDERHPEADGASGSRVVALLNGLGGVKYEELFVVFRRVSELLEGTGLTVVEPEVGELVTSFEMAGVSLTLAWLDDDLERLWRAPADSPSFRKNLAPTRAEAADVLVDVPDEAPTDRWAASEDSRESVPSVLASLEAVRTVINDNVEELGRLDAIAGDGDHGIGMQRGVEAAVRAARDVASDQAGAGTVLSAAGDAWADRAGGTSGALWGIVLRALGSALGDEQRPDVGSVATGVEAALAEVVRFGRAEIGDKTLVDVLAPFSAALREAADGGAPLVEAWATASGRADEAARSTAGLTPRIGRARPLAERSIGTPDPGAVSLALAIGAVNEVLATGEVAR
ncbi:dihydroxyacetone kinase family protein [Cellulomonas sp. P24]|uniref:dihydroxyacetone kinase family protein n=1 Tax=Cellulomonas sp. P24 TaxID=2885206 RepID=UPI00216AD21F|nr:dihydroxyacetone kinase family protein [Cellulomonas sp. P24]MCR6492607.1 dihydroxyacetone kinase family protein [Cellulomonas sp. P24]